VETLNQPYGGLILPATHIASMNNITALRILNFRVYSEQQTFTYCYKLFPLHCK